MLTLANTSLQISPLCLGGNVFGWTADVANSEAVLSYFVDKGGNFIDTADMYSEWAAAMLVENLKPSLATGSRSVEVATLW